MKVFGINSTDVDGAAAVIGRALKVEFRPHESDFNGGAYCRAETPKGTIIIQPNLDCIDREPFESTRPSERVVLYFSGLQNEDFKRYIDALNAIQELEIVPL